MFIIPMNGISPLGILSQKSEDVSTATPEASAGASFKDVFKEALNNVEETQRVSQEDSLKVALGEIDDLHTVGINLQKAQVAVDVFVSMKNTALDAYREVMSMSI